MQVNAGISEKTISSEPMMISCTYCKRIGHGESICFMKNGKPNVRCLTNYSRCSIMPTATVSLEDGNHIFSYMVDSGAD